MISLKSFWKSLYHAVAGIVRITEEEQSFRLQIIAGAGVFGLMIVMGSLQTWERVALSFIVLAVLVLEIVNSIFERFIDAVAPRVSPVVRDIKDMMAGAVLLTAIVAVMVGYLIFWPHIMPILQILWRACVI
ncbi:MAG: diacylglycerol kinase [Patescibacteria group bacterium]|jgi:diacylglycerol kinase